MINDTRIIKKQVKEYSRGKDKPGKNLRINLAQQDNLTGTVYIMSSAVFKEYCEKYQDNKGANTLPTTIDTDTLTTDIVTGLADTLKLFKELEQEKDQAVQDKIKLEIDNTNLNNRVEKLQPKCDKQEQQLKDISNLSRWQLLTGKHKKIIDRD